MRGQRTDKPTQEKIRALYASGLNPMAISHELKMPYSSVKSIVYRFKAEEPKNEDEKTLAELRLEKQKEFINNAWESAMLGSQIVRQKLTMISSDTEAMAATDMREITTSVGTMIDKARLASGEATQIIDGQVAVVRFEDL